MPENISALNVLAKEKAFYYYENLRKIFFEKKNAGLKIHNLLRTFIYSFNTESKSIFSGLEPAAIFIFEYLKVEDFPRKCFWFLLRETKGKNFQPDLLKEYSAAFEFLIYYFSSFPSPHNLFKNTDFKNTIKRNCVFGKEKLSFFCVIIDLTEDSGVKKIKAYSEDTGKFELILKDLSTLGKPETSGKKFHLLHKVLRKYQKLYLDNIIWIKEKIFTVSEDSIIAFMPDFQIDVSSAAETFVWDKKNKRETANPYLFFLKYAESVKPSLAMIKGMIVNDFLDEILFRGLNDGKDFFGKRLQAYVLQALNFDNSELSEIFSEIKNIYQTALIEFSSITGDSEILVEPSFYSAKFGLQGRLDVLAQSKISEAIQDIYELKSGNPPNGKGVWLNHRMQVIGYRLLLNDIKKRITGDSAVFYPKVKNNFIREVKECKNDAQRFVMLRNFTVSLIIDLASEKKKFTDLIIESQKTIIPPFKHDFVYDINKKINSLSPIETDYVNECVSFVFRELIEAKSGNGLRPGFSSLWLLSQEEKKESDQIISELRFHSFNKSEKIICFEKQNSKIDNFRLNDIIVIYPVNSFSPIENQIYKGVLQSRTADKIYVKFRNHYFNDDFFDRDQIWQIEHDMMDRGYYSVINQMTRFASADKDKRMLLLGLRKPEYDDCIPELSDELTALQKEIVTKAVQTEDYFLIQGPPGTGKTSYILLNIVKSLLAKTDFENIFLLGFTNRSIEEISDKLRKADLNFIRFGNSGNEEDIYNLIHKYSFEELKIKIRECRIFTGTVASFKNMSCQIKNLKSFDVLIVDEAAQLLESDIIGIASEFDKMILIGDQNQLPAVVTQNPKKMQIHSENLRRIHFTWSGNSLFERLFFRCRENEWDESAVVLREHFRMHAKIADLINPFYDGKLKPASEKQKYEIKISEDMTPLEKILYRKRVIFIESKPEFNFTNCHYEEAKLISVILRNLNLPENPAEYLGIITPFRSQIGLIGNEIRKIPGSEQITVDTVERFQGAERNLIIFSFGLNKNSDPESITAVNSNGKVDRKLNVMLSRAKDYVILTGTPGFVKKNIHYEQLLKKLQKNNALIRIGDRDKFFKQTLQNQPRIKILTGERT